MVDIYDLTLKIHPRPGDYIILPPELPHYVSEHISDASRFSIIFNAEEKINKASWDKTKRIEDKFELEKTKAQPFEELRTEIISLKEDVQRITGEVSYPQIENIVLKQKLLNRPEQSIPVVNAAKISGEHKNLLAYSLSLLEKKRKNFLMGYE